MSDPIREGSPISITDTAVPGTASPLATEQPPTPTIPQTPSSSSNTEQSEHTSPPIRSAVAPGYFVDGYPEELHPDMGTDSLMARRAAREGSADTPEAEEYYRKLDRVLGPAKSQADDTSDLDEKLQHTSTKDRTSPLDATGAVQVLTPAGKFMTTEHDSRSGLSRHDTDSYEDYPVTEPESGPVDQDASLPPTPGSPFSPTRISPSAELKVSPYASEHDVPTTPSPQPRKTPSPELGHPGSRNEDHYAGRNPEEHMDHRDTPSPPISPAPAHEEHKDKEGGKKVGIVEKVVQMLGKTDIKDSKEEKE